MNFEIPLSTFIVIIIAICVSTASNLLTRRFVNLDAERRMKTEISSFNKELRAAVQAKDKDKEERLRKKEKQMAQMRLKISSARTKIGFATIVPFLAVYYFMSWLLGGLNVIVAHSPIPIPLVVGPTGDISLFWWYFVSSLVFSGLMTRVLGTAT